MSEREVMPDADDWRPGLQGRNITQPPRIEGAITWHRFVPHYRMLEYPTIMPIWLEPMCEQPDCPANFGDCRIWYKSDALAKCVDCGRPAVKYVLAEPEEPAQQ